jgi:hypothetical protein
MIPGMDVEGGIFEAVRSHETEKSPAFVIGSGLIRESDAQIAIVAEQSRRVPYDRAGLGIGGKNRESAGLGRESWSAKGS